MKDWFAVHKEGLRQQIAEGGVKRALFELWQNAQDQNVTTVEITFAQEGRLFRLIVKDDDPEGFRDLTHAWTLFAPSEKKADPGKAGRFNLGEKLVLALCDRAMIATTKGTVTFDKTGRVVSKKHRSAGSIFDGYVHCTAEEYREACEAFSTIVPRLGVRVRFNGTEIAERKPVQVIEETLPTVLADSMTGELRRTERKTIIEVHEPLPGETPMLYELGIPVVATEDRWHYNVMQKVPLNRDRDNVPPSYLARLRAVVLNTMHQEITTEDAATLWVEQAMESDQIAAETVQSVMVKRFGERSVIFDPSDPEANKRAALEGYNVIPGQALSAEAWAHVREAQVFKPAGQVTPTPKPYSPDGSPLERLPEDRVTPAMRAFRELAVELANRLFIEKVSVVFVVEATWPFGGTFGAGAPLVVNVGRLGYKWFEGDLADIVGFLIHEFGHYYATGHLLGKEGYDTLADVGARVTMIALREPGLFKQYALLLIGAK